MANPLHLQCLHDLLAAVKDHRVQEARVYLVTFVSTFLNSIFIFEKKRLTYNGNVANEPQHVWSRRVCGHASRYVKKVLL